MKWLLLISVLFVGGCGTSTITPYKSDVTGEKVTDCSTLAPYNPYQEGSGHYAGWEWGAEGKSCGGNSSSFIEGCETYENQDVDYTNCLDK